MTTPHQAVIQFPISTFYLSGCVFVLAAINFPFESSIYHTIHRHTQGTYQPSKNCNQLLKTSRQTDSPPQLAQVPCRQRGQRLESQVSTTESNNAKNYLYPEFHSTIATINSNNNNHTCQWTHLSLFLTG